MDGLRITTIAEKDGELHLTALPFRKGDRVEAVLVLIEGNGTDRERACVRFLERAAASALSSSGPYLSRDDLHERP